MMCVCPLLGLGVIASAQRLRRARSSASLAARHEAHPRGRVFARGPGDESSRRAQRGAEQSAARTRRVRYRRRLQLGPSSRRPPNAGAPSSPSRAACAIPPAGFLARSAGVGLAYGDANSELTRHAASFGELYRIYGCAGGDHTCAHNRQGAVKCWAQFVGPTGLWRWHHRGVHGRRVSGRPRRATALRGSASR
jgi:hypothetical protein